MFQNDVGTLLEFTCYDEDDTALDLTTAEHVYLFIKRGTEILKREMVIDDDPQAARFPIPSMKTTSRKGISITPFKLR